MNTNIELVAQCWLSPNGEFNQLMADETYFDSLWVTSRNTKAANKLHSSG